MFRFFIFDEEKEKILPSDDSLVSYLEGSAANRVAAMSDISTNNIDARAISTYDVTLKITDYSYSCNRNMCAARTCLCACILYRERILYGTT